MELQRIQNRIYEIRDVKVMLDFDLAELFEVETRILKQAVRRNIDRFPTDFMFELTNNEYNELKMSLTSQSVMSNDSVGRGGVRYLPFAFTELGVAMLSSVLRSEKAIQINMSIMRAFVMLRQYALSYTELKKQLDDFMLDTNMQFSEIYQALTELAEQKRIAEQPRKQIGFGMNRNIDVEN